jgi:hypothetical protein
MQRIMQMQNYASDLISNWNRLQFPVNNHRYRSILLCPPQSVSEQLVDQRTWRINQPILMSLTLCAENFLKYVMRAHYTIAVDVYLYCINYSSCIGLTLYFVQITLFHSSSELLAVKHLSVIKLQQQMFDCVQVQTEPPLLKRCLHRTYAN